MTPTTLGELLARLKAGQVVPLPTKEDWSGLIARLNDPGRICEVSEETRDYFLEVLPPRWMAAEGFAFGEGADPLRLFWAVRLAGARRFYCRQMTAAESLLFCRLAGIPRTTG